MTNRKKTRHLQTLSVTVIMVLSQAVSLPAATKTASTLITKRPYEYVDPFIGCKEMGHTFPGAVVPFGMVQVSPDTDNPSYVKDGAYNPQVYRYCAGYQYNDATIVGFSHTHFSGTGHSDLGDFLIMPTSGERRLEPGRADHLGEGYRSRFSHQNEAAVPGYYRVKLENYGIEAEMTASPRVGFHKFTFPASRDAHIILDMVYSIYDYEGKVIWSSLRVESPILITGYRQTRGWGRARYLYFAMAFSKPFKNYGYSNSETIPYHGFWDRAMKQYENFPEMAGRKVRAYFDFDTKAGEPIMVKVALSGVSTEGALKNLQAEIPHWDFDRSKAAARAAWEAELNKVEVTGSPSELKKFYTSLYHSLLSPIEYMDVDGQYRGLDNNIHRAEGFTNYTLFSFWDTYRALHPWLTVMQPRRSSDIIRSMLAHHDQSAHKILPIWSFQANEDWCMIGYHAVPVIVDAYIKGIRGFDVEKAFQAAVDSATHASYAGLGSYMKYGYVPCDLEFGDNSASKTLEYAYDDWTIGRFAKILGKEKEAQEFMGRAANYRRLFDPQTGFIRARTAEGNWLTPFNAYKTTGQGYIEGNAWNYSLHIPQDIRGFIGLLGGNTPFIEKLDTLFTMATPEEAYAESEDIEKNGILGGYVHGNEPSHHIPYLYNFAGAPWKTQAVIHKVVDRMYTTAPDGIPGNDDTGQMSAWYLFSVLGFYPVCPGTDQYVIGSPCVKKAEIHLENGRTFTMTAIGLSPQNIYIQSADLNGRPLTRSFITHDEIINGGALVFKMGRSPNRSWAAAPSAAPYSMSE